MTTLAALQPYVVGTFLLWAGLLKVVRPSAQAALAQLVGQERVRAALRSIGAVEIAVAALLLAGNVIGGLAIGVAGAIVLSTAFLAYLGYARIAAPGSSCGCLGSRGGPVGAREFARAGSLLVAGLLAAGPGLLTLPTVAGAAVVAGELAVLVMLSPELDRYWLLPVRRAIVRLARPLRPPQEIPLAVTVSRLRRSPAFCSLSGQIRSDVLESWDEDDWRFVTFSAADGQTAVFAVPLEVYASDQVRAALVA